MKIVLLGDASTSGHFGCKLVTQAILDNLEKRGHDIIRVVPWNRHWRYYEEDLKKCDLVVVNGEGSIHHGRHMEMLEVALEYPSVLINCVYQDVPENEAIKHFLYVSVRESRSAEEMKNHGVTPEVVPDVVFYHDIPKPEATKDLCIVDSVTNERNIPDCVTLDAHDPDFVNKLGQYKRVVTGRFHALCLAMMWGMPFTAYPSNTHKTIGMLEDAGYPDAYTEMLDIIFEPNADLRKILIDKEYNKAFSYAVTAKQKIQHMFDFISNINPLKTNVHINTPDKKLLKNIELSKKRKLSEIEPLPPKTEPVAIVGGGPSLCDTLEQLRSFPGPIVSTNNTHDYLVKNGINPNFYVMSDAKRDNFKYIEAPLKDTVYLISSKCNPKVFNTLNGSNICLWHEYLNIGEPENVIRVQGGSTVGLKCINLMYLLGFRDFHLFGMDSCFMNDKHHAYSQPVNDCDYDKIVTVTCGDKSFSCSPWMAHQANDFKSLLTDLGHLFTVKVYGDGLLSQIIKEANRLTLKHIGENNASTS